MSSVSAIQPPRVATHGIVFIVMPYRAPHAGHLANLICDICRVMDFEGRLADEPIDPAVELRADIFEYIRQAEIVIVDLANQNPNVAYELGIARALNKRIVELHPKRQPRSLGVGTSVRITYGDLRIEAERTRLRGKLEPYLKKVQKEIRPEILDSAKARTNRILADLKTLSKLSPKQLCRQTIWWSGFLSSFAVGPEDTFEPSEEAAKPELLLEKEALLKLAVAGCRVVCMISPPDANRLARLNSQIVERRMRSLLNFLRGNNPALKHIDWLVAKSEPKNLYIIGNICCYERFQKVEDRGEAITLRQSSAAAVRANLAAYELLFRELAYTTLNGMPPADPKTLRSVLQTATKNILCDTLEAYDSKIRQRLAEYETEFRELADRALTSVQPARTEVVKTVLETATKEILQKAISDYENKKSASASV